MIRYALICGDCTFEFEAWFASSDAFDAQKRAGHVQCANCDSEHVSKQIMAPAVASSKPGASSPVEAASLTPEMKDMAQAFGRFAKAARGYVEKNFDYVGSSFAKEAIAIHEGDAPERVIYGETTPVEREALKEAGVEAAPLPDPFVPKSVAAKPAKGAAPIAAPESKRLN